MSNQSSGKPSHYPRSCVKIHYQAEANKPTRQTVKHSVVEGEVNRERENPNADDIDQTSHENTTNIVYFK